MICFPNCKINLGLSVLRKRKDGYHDIESILYPVPVNDILDIVVSKDGKFQFDQTGIKVPGPDTDNLCVKAYKKIKTYLGDSTVKMHLHKLIPPGSGLGGGSSDGAYALKIINDLFSLNLSNDELLSMAGELGNDCPFFINNVPSLVSGRGELLNPIDLKLEGYKIVIVKPDININTTYAYSKIIPYENHKSLMDIIRNPVTEWKDQLKNDFEIPVFQLYPEIQSVKEMLYDMGAVYSSMTGSGSAVYGVFEEAPEIKDFPPRYFVWSGRFE